MRNEIKRIDWHKPVFSPSSRRPMQYESTLRTACEGMGAGIRKVLFRQSIPVEVSLTTLAAETKGRADEAMKLKHARTWPGVMFVMVASTDAVGNAVGWPTLGALLVHLLPPVQDRWAYALCWLIELTLWICGFRLLRESAWKFWLRRALVRAIPEAFGGDEPATRVRAIVNAIGLVGTASLVVLGLASAPPAGALLGISLLLSPVIWLSLKAVAPILLMHDRQSLWGVALAVALQQLVGFFFGEAFSIGAQALPERSQHTFMSWQLGAAYFSIVAIAVALVSSWYERVIYVVSMKGQSDGLQMATHLYALVGLPAPSTWVRFEGPATYVVLARRPGEVRYHVQPPMKPLLLNEVEVSVVMFTSLSQIRIEPALDGTRGVELIRLNLPGSTALAQQLSRHGVSTETVEWLERIAQPEFGELIGQIAADTLQSPMHTMRDEWGRFNLEVERLTTDLIAVRSVPNWTRDTPRTDFCQELADSLRRLETNIQAMRGRVDLVSRHFSRLSIESRWKERFRLLLVERLSNTYQAALSETALTEVNAFLTPLIDAVPVRMKMVATDNAEMEFALKGPQEFERKLQGLLDEVARMRQELSAARDQRRHEFLMKLLDGVPHALNSSRIAAREYTECIQAIWSRIYAEEGGMDFKVGKSPAATVQAEGEVQSPQSAIIREFSHASPRVTTSRHQVTHDEDNSHHDGGPLP